MIAENLRKIFQNAGADALLIECDFLRRYLTGFDSSDGYVLLTGEKCILTADSRYIEAARAALKGSGIEVVEGYKNEAKKLAAPYKNLGVPYPFITASSFFEWQEGHELSDCMPALKEAMIVKSPAEISRIQKACEIAEDAFNSILPDVKEGMEERELAALLEYRMRNFGASGTSFDTIVAFGENGSVPHHETGARKLKFGDPILIDFGCKVEGYCSDCTRTFLFGDDRRHETFKTAYAHVLEAHERVLHEVHAGMTGKEADAVARNALKEHGLDKFFTHSLGHGIGLRIHEDPVLAPRGEEILRDGMVFSDEPGVYIEGELGIRIEDSVRMEQGKVVSFMGKTNKNLIIL